MPVFLSCLGLVLHQDWLIPVILPLRSVSFLLPVCVCVRDVCVRVCARVHVLNPFHYDVMGGVGTKWRTHMETYVFVLPCKSYKYLYGFLQLVPNINSLHVEPLT